MGQNDLNTEGVPSTENRCPWFTRATLLLQRRNLYYLVHAQILLALSSLYLVSRYDVNEEVVRVGLGDGHRDVVPLEGAPLVL